MELTDYEWNLAVAVRQPLVSSKLAGIVASLVPYYLREVERQVVREAELKKVADSQFVGQVGDRLITKVTCAKVITVGENSEWGVSYLHRLIDDNGNALVWFSSNAGNNLNPGKTVTVKGTVKKHETRNNVNQTTLSRISVLTDEQVAKELKKAERAALKAAKAAKAA
jgi:hypothetical protein